MSTTKPYDPFPEETASFDQLPEDCPLHHLDYGILSEKIQVLVIEQRRERRDKRLQYLVKTINNTLLMDKQRSFVTPYIYAAALQDWRNTGTNKKEILHWFNVNNIPLIYLEELLQEQRKGPPKFEINDYIQIGENRSNVGVVRTIKGKTIGFIPINVEWSFLPRGGGRCDHHNILWTAPQYLRPWDIANLSNRRLITINSMRFTLAADHPINPIDDISLPVQQVFRRGPYEPVTANCFGEEKVTSVWRCKKIGRNDRWEEEYLENKQNILKEIHRRQSAWYNHPILRDIPVTKFHGWFNLNYNILDKKERPPCPSYLDKAEQDFIWSLIKKMD